MILVLHGANTNASYQKLKELEAPYDSKEKVKLGKEENCDDLIQSAFSPSIVSDIKLIIAQNFIKDKKVSFKGVLWRDDPEKTLIFYETSQLTSQTTTTLPKNFKVETFKEEPKIFWFLDAISQNKRQTLMALSRLDERDEEMLIWHLGNRFLLLILARLNFASTIVSNITGRPIAPWQWQKIKNQASRFNLISLKNILKGVLKIDYLIKTGQTSLPQKTLISYLLLKYL